MVINAVHAIEDKKERRGLGQIAISSRQVPGYVEVAIADDGIGISPENRARIFDLFYTTKVPGRGTGQGLSLAHTIIGHNHGGRIDVDSEPGVGTTFVIRLPIG